MSQNNVPVNEIYWSLVAKADKKFSKIRDLPYYERNRYDTHFSKVFKVYTQLWKFQQENRQKLVEAGLKRWEIGDIASRIGQLYFGQYMRTSEANYLSESYIFYEAVLTREYFKDGVFQDLSLSNKQLRFFARFLTVCLVLNRREMVYHLVNQFKMLVAECKRTFQETDFKEWKLVIQEIAKFLEADTGFMNIRPLRYSFVLDPHPDSLPHVANTKRKLKLRDAILCSYRPNEVKFSELTLDNFRMLQCLEWEPSGSFYRSSGTPPSGAGANIGPNGGLSGPSRINYSQDITDPTLPPNPRKAVLYRPSVTHLLAVLATACEELPPDGVLLIYLSAPGSGLHATPSPSRLGNYVGAQPLALFPDLPSSTFCSACDSPTPSLEQSTGDCSSYHSGGLNLGARGSGGLNLIYPCDLIPFTRRPIFLVIDSDNSNAFKAINRAEKGEPVAILLSPSSSCPVPGAIDPSRQPSGSLFTSFLTSPLQAFLILLGYSGSDVQMDMLRNAEKALSSSLNNLGETLSSSDTLHPVWAQVLGDPFLRRLLLRFIFCQAALTLYAPTFNKKEYLPQSIPSLPNAVLPIGFEPQLIVLEIANIFSAARRFVFSEGIIIPEHNYTNESISSPETCVGLKMP